MVVLTACRACLGIKDVDSDGLCEPCSPTDEGMRDALLTLLQPYQIKEVTTPRENNHDAS